MLKESCGAGLVTVYLRTWFMREKNKPLFKLLIYFALFCLGFFSFLFFFSRKQNLHRTDIVHYGFSYNSYNSLRVQLTS